MNSIHPSRHTNLWLRIAGPFLLFVVAGSLALAAWLQLAARRESAAVFTALAGTNAEFIKSARLPASEQMMSYLGHLLNMHAFLVRHEGGLLPEPGEALVPFCEPLAALRPEQGVMPLGGKWEAIAAPVAADLRLVLVRPAEPALAFVSRRET